MEITILGSAGSLKAPRIGCECRVCTELRENHLIRGGPSIFINDLNLLIDTPDDIFCLLNKNNINKISSVFYSHWHHDHVAGMALFENINKELNNCLGDEGTINHEVKLFIPKDLLKVLEQNTYFKEVLVKRKYVKPVVGEYHDLNGFSLEIIRMCDLPCYCLIISKDEKKVAICMDHGKYLNDIKDKLDNLDLLICNAGFFNKELKGLDVISEEHPLNKTTSFESTMKLIKEIKPKKTVFLHIEELWNKTLGDFEAIEKEHSKYNIKFAMDGLKINL